MKRPEKEAVVAQLTDKFREADAIYLTEYRGLFSGGQQRRPWLC